jgi:hypothetical protein
LENIFNCGKINCKNLYERILKLGINELLTIAKNILDVVGIVVGIIGGIELHTANKIKNIVKNVNNSTIQQAQTITIHNENGMDTWAVIKLSRETTQEELQKELKEIISQFNQAEAKITSVEEKVDNLPTIHVGPTPPDGPTKPGDLWFKC